MTTVVAGTCERCGARLSKYRDPDDVLCAPCQSAPVDGLEAVGSLINAIRILLDRGDTDPREIAEKIIRSVGREWLVERLLEHAYTTIADHARREIQNTRKPPSRQKGESQVPALTDYRLFKGLWPVPGRGMKRFADLDADDCDAFATHFSGIAKHNAEKAKTFAGYAKRLRAEGAARLADLASPPAEEELAA